MRSYTALSNQAEYAKEHNMIDVSTHTFIGPSLDFIYQDLNNYLNAKPPHRLISIQQTALSSRLATETTFQYSVTFLIAVEIPE